MNCIIGVDPGFSGAIAALYDNDLLVVIDIPVMGVKSKRMVNGLEVANFFKDHAPADVIIEKSQAFPGQGVTTAFRYGMAYGQVVGVIQSLGFSTKYTSAAGWKKAMGLDSDKENSRRRAIETFPNHIDYFRRMLDHNRAEAALLAKLHRDFLRCKK